MKNNNNRNPDLTKLHKAMITRILEGDGRASNDQRRAVFENKGLIKPLSTLIDKVAKRSYKVIDEDIVAVKATGLSEDQIFELIICAAIGQSTRQYETALAALEEAITDKRRSKHAS